MRIVCDQREKLPYTFTGPQYEGVEVERGTLVTGDYSLHGFEDVVSCERKSLNDLIKSMTTSRDRFERELARGQALRAFAVVIEGSFLDLRDGNYGPRMWPKAACQSVLALSQRYRVAFLFAGNRAGGEYAVHGFLRHFLEDSRKRLDAIVKAHDAA